MTRLWRLIRRVLFLTPRPRLPIEVTMRLRTIEHERALRMERYAHTLDRLWAEKKTHRPRSLWMVKG